jgi:Tfp pilus assembly protein PilX
MQKQERGATLITCLVLITACMLFSQVLVESLVLEFRSQANYVQKTERLNAAENTLSEIKTTLNTFTKAPALQPYCAQLSCVNIFKTISDAELSDVAWWKSVAVPIASRNSEEENYVLLQALPTTSAVEKPSSTFYYEAWIFSHHKNNHSAVILKSVFSKRFDPKEHIPYPANQIAWQQFR